MEITFDLAREEINQLLSDVQIYQVQLRSEIFDLIDRTADRILNDAVSRVPVDSGKLRDSIKKRLYDESRRIAGDVVATAPHAHLVELGTSRSHAQPFMTPAYEAHVHRFLADLKRLLDKDVSVG